MLSFNVAQLKTANIIILGNSISTENYAPGAGWPRVMRDSLRNYCQSQDLTVDWSASISGQTTTQILERTPWRSRLKPGAVNIAIVFEGSNDLLARGLAQPDRVQKVADNNWGMCMAMAVEGWRVIVMGTTPRNHGYPDGTSQAQYAADCLALDAKLKASEGSGGYDYFSLRDNVPQYTYTAPCCPDGVHPEAYGCWMIGYTMAAHIYGIAAAG